ncbi:MAG: VWA domain-containing protein [Vicinamibacterales bacterium]
MKRLAIGSLVCALLAGVTLFAQQVPVFKGTTETVPVFVTVTDGDNRLVTTLERDDFVLLDNGRRQQLAIFDNSPQPVRLIVMLDVSGSMYGNVALLRAASRQLLARLGPEDQARLGTFGNEVFISPTFTNDAAALIAALPTEIPASAPTPLWNALDKALDAFEGVQGRRVILVLSDGKDSGPIKFNQRYVTFVEVAERAQREEVMIYSIGMRSRSAPGRQTFGMNVGQRMAADLPDPGLGTIAQETGGGYIEITPRDDLAAAFERVVDELHSQYLLGFAPPDRDGKRHKIEVKVGQTGLKARARKNYVAPKQG